MYFECNIDPKIPQYYHPEIYSKLVSTVALIHESTDLSGHLVKHSGVIVALFLQCSALLIQFHDAHDGFTAIKVLDCPSTNHILGILVDEL